jgi:hypothetical protein
MKGWCRLSGFRDCPLNPCATTADSSRLVLRTRCRHALRTENNHRSRMHARRDPCYPYHATALLGIRLERRPRRHPGGHMTRSQQPWGEYGMKSQFATYTRSGGEMRNIPVRWDSSRFAADYDLCGRRCDLICWRCVVSGLAPHHCACRRMLRRVPAGSLKVLESTTYGRFEAFQLAKDLDEGSDDRVPSSATTSKL